MGHHRPGHGLWIPSNRVAFCCAWLPNGQQVNTYPQAMINCNRHVIWLRFSVPDFERSLPRETLRQEESKKHEASIGNNAIYWIHWMHQLHLSHQLHIHTYEGNIYNMGIHMKMDRVENTVAHMDLTIAGWKSTYKAAVSPWTIISTIDLGTDCWSEAVRSTEYI